MKNQIYNYSKLSILNKFFVFIFVCIFIFLSVTPIIIFTLNKPNLKKFYFLQIASFPTEKSAQDFINKTSKEQNNFYIYYNHNYKIFIDVFSREKEAENLQKKLKFNYRDSTIFYLDFNKKVNRKSLSKKQVATVQNIVNICHRLISIVLNYNLKNYNKLSHLFIEFFKEYKTFILLFKNNSKFNSAKSYLHNIYTNFYNISNLSSEQESKFILRYSLIDTTINFVFFTKYFN